MTDGIRALNLTSCHASDHNCLRPWSRHDVSPPNTGGNVVPALGESTLTILRSLSNRKSPHLGSRSLALLGAVDAGECDNLWCYRRGNEPAVMTLSLTMTTC